MLGGEDGPDRLLGGNGRDGLFGLAGDDVLAGGPHRDRGSGGDGDDTCRAVEDLEDC